MVAGSCATKAMWQSAQATMSWPSLWNSGLARALPQVGQARVGLTPAG
jgi:hypothetical protein